MSFRIEIKLQIFTIYVVAIAKYLTVNPDNFVICSKI